MDFRETKPKALSVINQLRDIAKVSVRNVLKDANGKFQKDLVALEGQINSTRFTVGVVGEFDVGKSTFLNALLRRELLSAAILPETAAITSLNYGAEDKATVYYWTAEEWATIEFQGKAKDQDNKPSTITKMVNEVKSALGTRFNELITRRGEKTENIPLTDLEKYTSAKAEDGYAKLVREVEISTNLEFCRDNIQIVDTPGLNDPVQFREYITVDKFLPRCDMLVLLLMAKKVFTQSEKDFLEKQLKKGQLHKLFVIVNQTDLLHSQEKSVLEQIIVFVRTQLKETFEKCEGETAAYLADQLEIFPMSAYQSFLNRTGQPAKWTDEQSGVPAFEARLRQFLFEGERARKMQEIWQNRLRSFVVVQFSQIDEQLVNLDKPIQELEETLREWRRERDILKTKINLVSSEVEKLLVHFEREYQELAVITEENVRYLAPSIAEKAAQKTGQFLEKTSALFVTSQVEKWFLCDLRPFLQKEIKSQVEKVLSDTSKRLQQLVEGILGDFQIPYKEMVDGINSNVGLFTVDHDWFLWNVLQPIAGGMQTLAIDIVDIMDGTNIPQDAIAMGVNFFARSLLGLIQAKPKVYAQVLQQLSREVPSQMNQMASEIRKRFLDKRNQLVEELRKVTEAPALEIKAQLQQQEANLNQLLNDKKSQEVDIQKQRDALAVEKIRLEQVLLEINVMM